MVAGLHSEALLLGQSVHGEADRIVTLYTRAHGKLTAVAPHARRSRKRFGAGLALFILADVTLSNRRGSELLRLEDVVARRDFSGLARDVVAMAHASYATELVRELTPVRQPDPTLLDLLVNLYDLLQRSGPSAPALRLFELRLLEEVGLGPRLDACVSCGGVLAADGLLVSPSDGGVLCAPCGTRRQPRAARQVSPEVIDYLRALAGSRELGDAAALPPRDPDVTRGARDALQAFIGAHLSRPLKSMAFLTQLGSPAMMRDLDVLCFGEVLVDFFPEVPGQRLEEVARFMRSQGGAPANLAVGLARLGGRAAVMTLVGKDPFGAFLRRALTEAGVDVSAVGEHPTARTGLSFISVDGDGERDFLSYRSSAADRLIAPADVRGDTIARSVLFHFGSSTLARPSCREATWHAVEVARAAGCVISSDPNPRTRTWEQPSELVALVRRGLAATDVVKVSHDELELLGLPADPARAARVLRAWGPALVVVTLGPHGCLFDGVACGTGHVPVPGDPVRVVDCTGAGDGFWAGFLSRVVPILREGATVADLDAATLQRALQFANRVGARVVTRFGATAALPYADDPALVSGDDP